MPRTTSPRLLVASMLLAGTLSCAAASLAAGEPATPPIPVSTAIRGTDTLPTPTRPGPRRAGSHPLGPGEAAVTDVTGVTLDVVNAWTPEAEAAAGGRRAMQDISATAIASTNTVMENNGIGIRLRLVGTTRMTGMVDLDQAAVLAATQDPSGVAFGQARSLRASTRAHLLMAFTASGCGIAYQNDGFLPDYAVGAVSVACQGRNRADNAYAHEVGHLLGLHHDHAVEPEFTGTNAGYTSPEHGIRDVMSYEDDCLRRGVLCDVQPFWSDPTRRVRDWPIGDATADAASFLSAHLDRYAAYGRTTSRPVVTASWPVAAAAQVPGDVVPSVTFSTSVHGWSGDIRLEDAAGTRVLTSPTYDGRLHRVSLRPLRPLSTGWYRIVIGAGVSGDDGVPVAAQTVPFAVGEGVQLLTHEYVAGDRPVLRLGFSHDVEDLGRAVRVADAAGRQPAYTWQRVTEGQYELTLPAGLATGTWTVSVEQAVSPGGVPSGRTAFTFER